MGSEIKSRQGLGKPYVKLKGDKTAFVCLMFSQIENLSLQSILVVFQIIPLCLRHLPLSDVCLLSDTAAMEVRTHNPAVPSAVFFVLN